MTGGHGIPTNGIDEMEAQMDSAQIVSSGMATVKEAGDFLAVSRSSIYALMEAGKLHWVKIQGSRRIPRKSLVALASANLKGGWQAPPL
jgi:excisionase family DNA binding protein